MFRGTIIRRLRCLLIASSIVLAGVGCDGQTDFCTDGTLDPGEFCDDGNTISLDACNNSCTCGSGYHVQSGVCASDVQACAILYGTGTERWTGSAYGSCLLTACDSGYHANGNACDANVISCSLSNATTATQTWNNPTRAYGVCTATACATDFALCSGDCVSAGQPLGAACACDAECASGFCASGPAGTANDRCAPTGMNYIPAGTFMMGSPSGEVGQGTDEAQHSVTLTPSFFMGQTEVTQGQWKALSGGINPSYVQSITGSDANDRFPVERVDWYSAISFANACSAAEGLPLCYAFSGCTDQRDGWKDGQRDGCTGATFAGLTCTGYRLPTESEWEYAARGGTTTATYRGNLNVDIDDCSTAQTNLDGIAWWCKNSDHPPTHAVGSKTANSLGLSDMLGNVWEWTGDWYGTYPGTVTDPLGAGTGSYRVFRGGSGWDLARFARAACRYFDSPFSLGYSRIGFRLARTAP